MHEQLYYEDSLNFDNLYKSMKRCCRNLRWKDSVISYEFHGLRNTYRLKEELVNNRYTISPYQHFKIYEPKERDIIATRFRDRQFQMSLCISGLYDDVVEHLITDNPACQTGKGTDYLLNRTTAQLRKYYRKYGSDGWVLHCDIRKFFPSTDHNISKSELKKYISDPLVLDKIYDIIDSFGPDKGIGLGSQISQLIELLILNKLDHYIRETLKPDLYTRYMDDMTLVCHDKDRLNNMLMAIKSELYELKFDLNEKTHIYPLKQGLKILKWTFYIVPETGAILRKMDKKKLAKQRKKMIKLWNKERLQLIEPGTTEESLRSFLANAQRGNTYYQRRKMIIFYEQLTGLKYIN